MNPGIFKNIIGFEWDKGNKDKNLLKHNVSNEECEEVFFDEHKKLFGDIQHSLLERRCILIGRTKEYRVLCVIFTLRKNYIRVISARDTSKKERSLYEKTI